MSATKTRRDVRAEVVASVIAAIEEGCPPWQSPYLGGGLPMRVTANTAYRGANVWLLADAARTAGYRSRWWGSYRQLGGMGGQVRKGEKGTTVTFWKVMERRDTGADMAGQTATKTDRGWLLLRAYSVFNVEQADWPEGMPERFAPGLPTAPGVASVAAERMIAGYQLASGVSIVDTDSELAWYSPSRDVVNVPPLECMASVGEWHSATFHELTHSTGHPSRLNREGIAGMTGHRRGELYAFEELIAEFGAAMCSAMCGMPETTTNSAAYLAGWAKYLTDAPEALLRAASAAQRAVDLIAGTTTTNDTEGEGE